METDQLPVALGNVMTMTGASSSRMSTPTTAVRPRPRPPSMLAVTSSPVSATLPRRSNSTDQSESFGLGTGGISSDDLSTMLTSLGRTDFMKKYGRRTIQASVSKTGYIDGIGAGSTGVAGSVGESSVASPVSDGDGYTWTVPSSSAANNIDVAVTLTGNHIVHSATASACVENVPLNESKGTEYSDEWNFGLPRASDRINENATELGSEMPVAATQDVTQTTTASGRRIVSNLSRTQSDSSPMRQFRLQSVTPKVDFGTATKPLRVVCNDSTVEEYLEADEEDPAVSRARDSFPLLGAVGGQPLSLNSASRFHRPQQNTQLQRPHPLPLPLPLPLPSRVQLESSASSATGGNADHAVTGDRCSNQWDHQKPSTSGENFESNGMMMISETQNNKGTVGFDVSSPTIDLSNALIRKNSKTGKPKSRSDPSGENSEKKTGVGGSGPLDIPAIVYGAGSMHAQSSPVLCDADQSNTKTIHLPNDALAASSSLDTSTSTTRFPFGSGSSRSNNIDDSASSLSDRGRHSQSVSDERLVGDVTVNVDRTTPSSMRDVTVRVVLKSDDSLDGADALPSSSSQTSVSALTKPPRPRAMMNRRPRAPPQATIAPVDSVPESASLLGIVPSKLESLTLPLQKQRTPLTRSHSSVGAETTSAVGGAGRQRPSNDSTGSPMGERVESTPSSVRVRRRSPGANEVPDAGSVVVVCGGGMVAPSYSVPELYSGGGSVGSTPASSSSTSTTSSATGTTSRARVFQAAPPFEPALSRSTLTMLESAAGIKDKRDLIMQEFYSTEHQYVETLRMLVEKYMVPLKTQNVVDSSIVDDVFYKINEIYVHHATFLTFLARALRDWDSNTTIGDVIEKNFSKQTVIESYMSFIEHFPRAEKVLDEVSTKSSFQKFIEQCERDTRTKLPLKAQIVKPAQRIPRYELLLKRLLDNTSTSHPDHALLTQAEKTIHELALRINSVKESKRDEDLQETVKKIELLLITDLSAPDRIYLRHDMITLPARKDQQYCMWLFNDLLVFSCIKRKAGSVNRRTSVLLQSPNGHDFVDNTKHKLWLKLSLDNVDMTHVDDEAVARQMAEKQELEDDSQVLGQIIELSSKLKSPHQAMEDALREVLGQVNKQLAELQIKMASPELQNGAELIVQSGDVLQTINVLFPSMDKKAAWETVFSAAKRKLAQSTDGRPPELLQSLQITKTRAGMQFSCASLSEPDISFVSAVPPSSPPMSIRRPSTSSSTPSAREVWVCNSDGYVGHMCLLSLQSEPIVTLNTPVPGCNSRITCICAVPPAVTSTLRHEHRTPLQHSSHYATDQHHQRTVVGGATVVADDVEHLQSTSPCLGQPVSPIQRHPPSISDVSGRTRRRHGVSDRHRLHRRRRLNGGGQDVTAPGGSGTTPLRLPIAPHIRIDELREESEDGYASDSTTDSFSANEDDDEDNDEEEADTEDQSSPSTEHPGSFQARTETHLERQSYSPPPTSDILRSLPPLSPSASPQTGSVTDEGCPSSASIRDGPAIDASKSTMWLGTEDGCVLIFASSDIIKTTKNKIKIQQNAGVLSIVHHNERVYVSIANGDILIYQRNKQDGCWDCTEPELVLGASNSAAPINRLLAVGGRLWCACLNDVIVFNLPSHEVEVRFVAISPAESKRGIQCMTTSGNYGVWLAGQGSSKVMLYHSTTFEQLLEVNVAPAVGQKLQTADDIIRQHKMACLRITALLTCKDQLWIGTSAGVILTLPLPKITLTTSKTSLSPPNVTGLIYGHTGHVRFLTSVDLGRSGTTLPASQSQQQSTLPTTTSSPFLPSSSPAAHHQNLTNLPRSSSSGSDSSSRRHGRVSSPPHLIHSASSPSSSSAAATTPLPTGSSAASVQPSSGITSARHRPPTPPTSAAAAAMAAASGGLQQLTSSSTPPVSAADSQPQSNWTLVISGGDGFEDFRPPSAPPTATGVGNMSAASSGAGVGVADVETTGKDDSTNHLLIWRVT